MRTLLRALLVVAALAVVLGGWGYREARADPIVRRPRPPRWRR